MSTEVKLEKSVEVSIQAAGLITVLVTVAAKQPGFDIDAYATLIENSLEKMEKRGIDEALLLATRTALQVNKTLK